MDPEVLRELLTIITHRSPYGDGLPALPLSVVDIVRGEYTPSSTSLLACMETKNSPNVAAIAAAPEGEMFDGREMALVHRMFRREFRLASGVVRQVHGGNTERAQTVTKHLRLLATILHHHHSCEDRYVWPLLERREPLVSGHHVPWVAQQHIWCNDLVSEVFKEAPIWSWHATTGSRNRLATLLDRLADALNAHMDYDEQYIVPLMESHITAAEWNEAVQTMVAGMDPASAELGLGMCMYEAEPDVIEQTVTHMPIEPLTDIRVTAAAAYAEHAQLIYGTATPLLSTEVNR